MGRHFAIVAIAAVAPLAIAARNRRCSRAAYSHGRQTVANATARALDSRLDYWPRNRQVRSHLDCASRGVTQRAH